MDKQTMENYEIWAMHDLIDGLNEDLQNAGGSEEELNDRFYRELEFGTAGLRGVLGAGTNRMNVYTVARATKGFAGYLCSISAKPSMAIAYDSRIKSDVFARLTAKVMAENGVKVYLWPELMPTPALSFAVRFYGCDGGVVITASHNPSQYNGYKAYDSTGCQLGEEAAADVFDRILAEPVFEAAETEYTFEQGIRDGMIEYIPESTFEAFVKECSRWSMLDDTFDRSVSIAYTPLYGTGLKCVTRCLKDNGFSNIALVEEQARPDGNFPTCPYPNPEIREAMEVGLAYAEEKGADLLIATDPDADRVGIAAKKGGSYELLTGNQTGMLLLDYMCRRRLETGRMPENPIAVKTIVTTDMIYNIAAEYGVEVMDVLTGFKNIAPIVTDLVEKGEGDRYILGFEESYGYMLGEHVRDKDSVSACLMIAEMFVYHRSHGKSLFDVLDEIYKKYGYYINTTHSYAFPGESGFARMQEIMEYYRSNAPEAFGPLSVLETQDYKDGFNGLKANVIKYVLDGRSMAVLRPSGTEPKLKLYLGIAAPSIAQAEEIEKIICAECEKNLK